MVFRFRQVKPKESDWLYGEAETLGDALQDAHLDDRVGDIVYRHELEEGNIEFVRFAVFEVKDGTQYVSRLFERKITRSGGVKLRLVTLRDIAQAIGWTHDPKELLAPWADEETWEEARERCRK